METIKILVVDDEPVVINGVEVYLQAFPYVIESVTKGEEALTLLQASPDAYALVIVDRMMFGMDGMDLLETMKSDDQLRNIPFIMQTGEAEQEDLDAAITAGADRVIFKGSREELIKAINELLRIDN